MNEAIDEHEKYTLFSEMANEDVFASIWLFGYFTKSENDAVLPNGGSFSDVDDWRKFLQKVLFDEEASESELLDTGNILEKLHGWYGKKGFNTKKEKKEKNKEKRRRSLKVENATPEEPAQVFISEKLLEEAKSIEQNDLFSD